MRIFCKPMLARELTRLFPFRKVSVLQMLLDYGPLEVFEHLQVNFTLPRAGDSKQFDEFAGGSASEFYELSGEGKHLQPSR